MKSVELPRRRLFEVWIAQGHIALDKSVNDVIDFVFRELGLADYGSELEHEAVRAAVQKVCYKIRERWIKSNKTRERFEVSNTQWLDTLETFSLSVSVNKEKNSHIGRPQKPFSEVCERSKRRKVEQLRTAASAQELALAAELNTRQDGNEDAAKLLHEAMQCSPDRASKMRKSLKVQQSAKPVRNFTEDEGLSLMLEADLSKRSYQHLRNEARDRNVSNLYPPYHKIQEAKKRCLPGEGSVRVSETCAEVKLQALLDHTASRLMTLQKDVVESLGTGEIELLLFTKWGFDGSSGQANYKQTFSDLTITDSSIFITSLVPLQLNVQNSPNTVIWYNIKSSSTRLCRPIRLQFAKETVELSLKEKANIEDQIKALVPTVIQVNPSLTVRVTHRLCCTMIDGKVCSALTGISCQRCCVCGAYPRELNKLDEILKKEPDTSTYQFGLSSLHAHIRFMECILHIAYRRDFQNGQARTPDQKAKMAARKDQIQNEFKSQIGLIIDVPKQGSGTTNDGNTARRFFECPAKTAAIVGIDEALISRFSVILQALSCGFSISPTAFRSFAMNTAKLYIQLYNWYPMPPSVHRVLLHGADIIQHFQIPISCLSEEPQESRNKDIKKFRELRARKCSRLATNTDVFNRLLISSDPLISSFRRPPCHKKKPLTNAVLGLLVPAVNLNNNNSESEESESSDVD